MPFMTWPRISPPLLAAVWTLKYQLAGGEVGGLGIGQRRLALDRAGERRRSAGTTTPAFALASAGPWKWAAVAGPLRSL